VQFPVGGDQLAGPVVGDGGVVDPAVRTGFEDPGDEREPGILGRLGEAGAERAV